MNTIHVESNVKLTPRVKQLREIFDLPMDEKVVRDWEVNLPDADFDWNIGLVVGPSGSGKTQLAKAFWGDFIADKYDWPHDGAVIDGFHESIDVNEVAQLLTNVGFSSPPSWLRPFHTLSNGEQFRAALARSIVDPREIVVIDEFTSVVDRTVAQIGSSAFAREIRKRQKHVILLSCHYDVIDWLQPDWIYYVDE
jgi:ABC-type glutathione transport system ATPase component